MRTKWVRMLQLQMISVEHPIFRTEFGDSKMEIQQIFCEE